MRTDLYNKIAYITRRHYTLKCTCGRKVFIGMPDNSDKRHGFCQCGLAWHILFNGRSYAHPME